jgi:outer membrane protein assembly factor BamB
MSQHFAAPIFAVPCIDTTRQRVYVAVEDRFLYAFNSAQFNVEWKLNVRNTLETNGSNYRTVPSSMRHCSPHPL